MSSTSKQANHPLETSATTQEHRQELERLSKACLSAWNDRDFDLNMTEDRKEFRERIHPQFEAHIENYPTHALTWDDLNKLWRDFLFAEPNCNFELITMSTDVNVNGTAAVLYVEMAVTGVQNVNLIRFLEMKWRVVRGTWMYCHCTTMGGTRANNGLI